MSRARLSSSSQRWWSLRPTAVSPPGCSGSAGAEELRRLRVSVSDYGKPRLSGVFLSSGAPRFELGTSSPLEWRPAIRVLPYQMDVGAGLIDQGVRGCRERIGASRLARGVATAFIHRKRSADKRRGREAPLQPAPKRIPQPPQEIATSSPLYLLF